MKIAVRYYTKTGNTRRLAEAVAVATRTPVSCAPTATDMA